MRLERTRAFMSKRAPELFAAGVGLTLIASLAVAKMVDREEPASIPKPPPTATGVPVSECVNGIMKATTIVYGGRLMAEEQVVGADNTLRLLRSLSTIATESCNSGSGNISFGIQPRECASVTVNGQQRAPAQVYVSKELPDGSKTLIGSDAPQGTSFGAPICNTN